MRLLEEARSVLAAAAIDATPCDGRDRTAAPLEADAYHGRVLALARRHRVPAPVNTRVLEHLLDAAQHRRGTECFPARALLP